MMDASTLKRGLTRVYIFLWALFAAFYTVSLFVSDVFHETIYLPDPAGIRTADATVKKLIFPVEPLLWYFGLAFVGPAVLLVSLRWVFDGFTRQRSA
jgi:hypothetical protein